jgi:hypothetical protein
LVELSERYNEHTFGAFSWNRIVFQWVPGQLVGSGTKNALMFDLGLSDRLFLVAQDEERLGSTPTGMGEAYLELGVFGFIFFYFTAYVMGRWWTRSMRGQLRAQLLYATGLTPAVLMPTAYPAFFIVTVILYLIGVFLLLLSTPTGQRRLRRFSANAREY